MRRRWLHAIEWLCLFVGLTALDVYVWVNTSSILYQAYQDWSFDETLRGLKPTVRGFVADEIYWFFGGAKGKSATSAPESQAPSVAQRPLKHEMLIGRMRIPRLGVMAMVREGADGGTLERAVGHIPGTALPGATGNVALAGHRDTFFRPLRNIRKDDAIELETTNGTYRYAVESTEIVSPRDVSVLAPAKNQKTLTLVTCYPFYYVGSAPKRFVVRAVETPTGVTNASFSPPRRPSGRLKLMRARRSQSSTWQRPG